MKEYHKLDGLDLSILDMGDWVADIGPIEDYAILGFLHHLAKEGYEIRQKQ
jgi:hypothetical protein